MEEYLQRDWADTSFATKPFVMNIKRIFGAVLTTLGIVGLIYGAILFVNHTSGARDVRALLIYGVLGLIFLFSGISLVRTTKDEA